MFVVRVILFIMCMGIPSLAQEPYRIGHSPGSMIDSLICDRLKTLYDRAGLPMELVPLPPKRSLCLVNEGGLDGESARVVSVERQYPNLRRVKGRILNFVGVAYVLKDSPITLYHKELLDTSKVGSLFGAQWSGRLLAHRASERVRGLNNLFEMLLEGRIDMMLISEVSGDEVLQTNEKLRQRIRKLSPVVFTAPLYHFVHKKNADIIPLLEKTLQELHAEDCWREGTTPSWDAVDGQQP